MLAPLFTCLPSVTHRHDHGPCLFSSSFSSLFPKNKQVCFTDLLWLSPSPGKHKQLTHKCDEMIARTGVIGSGRHYSSVWLVTFTDRWINSESDLLHVHTYNSMSIPMKHFWPEPNNWICLFTAVNFFTINWAIAHWFLGSSIIFKSYCLEVFKATTNNEWLLHFLPLLRLLLHPYLYPVENKKDSGSCCEIKKLIQRRRDTWHYMETN